MHKASKIVGLECEASAIEGARLLLRTRFVEMSKLRSAALDWSDIEGVHHMRVASRRLRSAIRDFKPHLKWRRYQRVSDRIKRIADSLGVVRDKDVAIAGLEKLVSQAPTDVAIGIEHFVAERRNSLEDDRLALVDAITEDQLASLAEEFEAALARSFARSHNRKKRVADDQHDMSFRKVGQTIMGARMEELYALYPSLFQPLSTKPLHNLRIAVKRLRYAIELFAQCWDSDLGAHAREVARMQTSLGELHDCDVWISEFGKQLEKQSRRQVARKTSVPVEIEKLNWNTLVWLLSHFTKKRTKHYRDALTRWQKWDTSDFFARLEACLQTLQVDGEVSHGASAMSPKEANQSV